MAESGEGGSINELLGGAFADDLVLAGLIDEPVVARRAVEHVDLIDRRVVTQRRAVEVRRTVVRDLRALAVKE